MTAPHFRNRRPSPEVRRVLDFVNRPLVHALGVFKDSDERCQRDVILIMAEPDETARWVHEQLRTFSPPHARPPVLEKNSVQVMAVPIKVLHEFLVHRFGPHEMDCPYEPDTARIVVLIDETIFLTRRRLRFRDADTYTAEQVRDHVTWMVRGVGRAILEKLAASPLLEGLAVVALFHGADEKAMRLYRRIWPDAPDVPEDGTVIAMTLLAALEAAAPLAGYEIDPAELAPDPAFVRIPVFTLGRMFVESMSKLTMEPGGDA